MPLTIEQWHERYRVQAGWTAALRSFLFDQTHLHTAKKVLEVGCGSGAVTSSIHGRSSAAIFGLDINLNSIQFARSFDPQSYFTNADALHLPFTSGSFNLTYCHYFLLWMKDKASQALREMARVTVPGGIVLALAEPDYSARVDAPSQLIPLGQWQNISLEKQGATINMGRCLPELFTQAGLSKIQFGMSGFQTQAGGLPEHFDSEWQLLENDLHQELTSQELAHYRDLDHQTWVSGRRVLHIPTFYAIGTVAENN